MPETLLILIVFATLVALALLLSARRVELIYPPNVGLLYRDGRFERELGPGRYSFSIRSSASTWSRSPAPRCR